ncbi:MAG: exopolyphosphatase [Bacteroidota bacterium]
MQIAVIDLGTNTFHLVIGEIAKQGYREVARKRVDVKLGAGGLQAGSITPAAQQRAIEAMVGFKRIIDTNKVGHVRAVATSAMRSASNAAVLIQTIKDYTGIAVEIISGSQEAALIYRGVKEAVQMSSANELIMDIGGGSVEFIIGNDQKASWKKSFEIGAQRLADIFHSYDPISPAALSKLERYLEEKLQPLFEASTLYEPTRLIGTSGAFTTLTSIYSAQKQLPLDPHATTHDLPLHHFEQIYHDIRYKSYEERIQIPGLSNQRVDMIVVSSALIQFVLSKTNISSITTSIYSLKAGLFFHALETARGGLS